MNEEIVDQDFEKPDRLEPDYDLLSLISVAKHFKEIQEQMPEKSTLSKILKALNYISGVTMFIAATLRFIDYDAKVIFMDGFYLAFTFYLYLFGLLIGAAEYQFVQIMKYVEFLISPGGKGMFLLFVGILLFDDRRLIDLWASLSISLIGMFNLIDSCMTEDRVQVPV